VKLTQKGTKIVPTGIGVKANVHLRKNTAYYPINKLMGIRLEKGQELFSYQGTCNGRAATVVFLDGKPRDESPELRFIQHQTFVEERKQFKRRIVE